MRSLIKITLAAVMCVGVLAGCQTMQKSDTYTTFGVNFAWTSGDMCSPDSPAFTLSDVPEGTRTLIFKMIDLDVPTYNHGGGKVAYTGENEIAAGAFRYKGPCPPNGVHDYQFTVKAVDETGNILLGEGKAVRPFPPSN